MDAELVVSDDRLPQVPECSEMVVGSLTSSSSPALYNAPVHLESTEKFAIPTEETTFTIGKLVIWTIA